MGTFLLAATVTVVNKVFFKYRGDMVKNVMVDYTVAKVGGKYFAFYRLINNEADALLRLVIPRNNLITQFQKVAFVLNFKFEGVDCVALVAAGIVVGLKQIG
jgi:hypothetical protein